jgi:tetratricopeptide (TPR) repeat protein
MGGLTCASAEAGARLQLKPGEQDGEVDLLLAVCPVRALENATVEVSVPGKTFVSEAGEMSPEAPWSLTRRIRAEELGGSPIRLMVREAGGSAILDAVLDRDPTPIEGSAEKGQSPPQTSLDYLQLGLRHENFDNREQAMQAYRKAVELSPENGEAQQQLGLMLLRAADFSGAKSHLQSALAEGQAEAGYTLGLLAFLDDELEEARRRWQAVPEQSPLRPAALLGLGTLSLRAGDAQNAAGILRQPVLQKEPPNLPARLLLGIALARCGQIEVSRRAFHRILEIDPLNHAALHELARLDGDETGATLERMLRDDPQYRLDLACFYLGAGLPQDALAVLETAGQSWRYPMVNYLAAYANGLLERNEPAKLHLEEAAQIEPDLCFPSRLEEVKALEYAIRHNPGDAKARYYLGVFYYAHQRYEEGVRLWEQALEGLPAYDVIYRNLGLAAWQRDQDEARASGYFERALELNPDNQDLYLHLDELYQAKGSNDKRAQLLDKIEALGQAREDVRKRRIQMLVDLGRYEQALEIMQSEKFVPLEMDQSFHNLYVRALLLRADDRLKAGDIEAAIRDYQAALEFPENLGVGMPTTLHQAHIYYPLGLAYERLGRYRQALSAWRSAAVEHHPYGSELNDFVQKALDKLSRYSEIGLGG